MKITPRQMRLLDFLATGLYEAGVICDCTCELDGPANSPDSVFRAKHTSECSVRKILEQAFEFGARSAEELSGWDPLGSEFGDGTRRK